MSSISLLEEWGWIDKEKPLWWDLDYPKDTRELMDFQEFERRLKGIGRYHLFAPRPMRWPVNDLHDIKIYTGENVPVTTTEVEVNGEKIQLFVTARPYMPKEVEPWEKKTQEQLEDELRERLESRGFWTTSSSSAPYCGEEHMFLPHVRGYFKELRGGKVIYYPIHYNTNPDHSYYIELTHELEKM